MAFINIGRKIDEMPKLNDLSSIREQILGM